MSVLSKLQIVLHADTAAYQRNIKKAGDSTKKTLADTQKSSNKLARNMGKDFDDVARSAKDASLSITSTISKITTAAKGAVAGFGLVELGRNVINAQREFDVLNAQLVTATGSMGDASAALKQLQVFAKETPYGLSQAVEGFAKLKSLGLTPSIDSLESFGNTASAMGKDLMQMIEAVADASTFEFERLKEFGIKASQQKDKVAFTFQGITTEVAKNAKEIEQYLLRIGEVQFAGAMATRMATLDGAISSLGDSWNAFLLSLGNAKIGDIGFIDLATSAVRTMSDTLDFASEHINDILLVAGGAMLYFGRTAIATGTAVAASWSVSMARKAASTVAAATSTARLGNALMAIAQGHTVPQMAMHRLTVAIQAKTAASMAFIRQTPAHITALKTAGAQARATARNFSVMTAAKNAGIASATLLGRGIMGVGSILSSVGRVIMTHPILTLSAIIGGIVVHVMGFEKAMESLSDAFAISKMMLGDLVDFALDGFVSMLDGAVGFLDGFFTSSEGTTTGVSGFFSGMFAGTQGGFVGLMQVAASAMDGIMAFARTACNYVGGAFGNLGTAIANVFKGVINFAASTFERGINNVIIKPINNVIEGFNKVSGLLGGGTIGTIGSVSVGRVDLGTYTPLNFDVASNNTGSVRSMVDDYVAAHNTAKVAARDAAQAAAAASSTASDAAKAAAKASESADKASKASKKAADSAKKASEELRKAYKEQLESYDRMIYDASLPFTSELNSILYEIDKTWGKFYNLADDQKENLKKFAQQADLAKIKKEILKEQNQLTKQMALIGKDSKFNEVLYDLNDKYNQLSLLGQAEKDAYLAVVARFEVDNYLGEVKEATKEYQDQLVLLSASNDFERDILTIKQEQEQELQKYNILLEHGHQELYDQIKLVSDQKFALRESVVIAKQWKEITQSLQDEESKKLTTLQNQLDVIAKQHKLMQSMPQMTSPIDPLDASFGVLKQALDLPSVPMNAIEQLESEHQSRLDMIKGFLDQQKQLYKDNEEALTRITEQGKQARAEVEEHYAQAKNKLILTQSESLFGSLANIAKDGLGKQSKAYRAMFAMQQGFAIAQASIAMSQAMSKGLEKGFPTGLADMAMAASHGAKIVSAIKSVVMPVGQAHDGIMSVPKSGTWNLEKGERVLPRHTAQNLDNTLNRLQGNGGGQVVINQHITINTDGSHDVKDDTQNQMGQAFKAGMLALIQGEMRQGRSIYNFVKNGR